MKIGRYPRSTAAPFKVTGPGYKRDKLVSLGMAINVAQRQAEQATGAIEYDVIEYEDVIYQVVRDKDGIVLTQETA